MAEEQIISETDSEMVPIEIDPTESPQASGSEKKTIETGVRKKMYTTVPISRVNTIMRSCPNLTTVKNDAVALMSQAAELFIQDLVKNTYESSENKESLSYDTLARYIAESEYEFLKDAIPERITVQDYYKQRSAMEQEKKDS